MGEEWGPMSAQELLAVARRGRLSRHDTVRQGTDGNWVRAEMVTGLFSTSPPAPTATARHAAISSRQPSPAKRSVQQIRSTQYWVKNLGTIVGPFSSAKLRQLAADGKLLPHYLVRDDRSRWVLASQVKGLTFGRVPAGASTVSARSTIWPLERLPSMLVGEAESPANSEAGDVRPVAVAF